MTKCTAYRQTVVTEPCPHSNDCRINAAAGGSSIPCSEHRTECIHRGEWVRVVSIESDKCSRNEHPTTQSHWAPSGPLWRDTDNGAVPHRPVDPFEGWEVGEPQRAFTGGWSCHLSDEQGDTVAKFYEATPAQARARAEAELARRREEAS